MDEREMLAARLRAEYLGDEVPAAVAVMVFRKAWEDGHDSGEHEVEQQYDNLAEIVRAAVRFVNIQRDERDATEALQEEQA
jgi:hypothetical protein